MIRGKCVFEILLTKHSNVRSEANVFSFGDGPSQHKGEKRVKRGGKRRKMGKSEGNGKNGKNYLLSNVVWQYGQGRWRI